MGITGNLMRRGSMRNYFFTATQTPSQQQKQDSNSKRIELVVVMSVVELWKAWQLLLSSEPRTIDAKWRTVGISEKEQIQPRLTPCVRISSTAPTNISAGSPTLIHRHAMRKTRRGFTMWGVRGRPRNCLTEKKRRHASGNRDCWIGWR